MNYWKNMGLAAALAVGTVAAAQAQQGAIRGRVTTSDGAPAEAVTVGLKGQGQGAITDEQGRYGLERVRDGSYTLVVSALGLQTAERPVTVRGGQAAAVDFVLTENAAQLAEVVVRANRVNRFARKASDYVGKMPLTNLENPQVYATVGKEVLAEQLVYTVDDALRNAPGVQRMWEATGRAGDGGGYYNSRGFVLQSRLRNGIAGNVTSDIDASNLEKLEVIKGPSATLFGSALTSYGGLLNRVTKKPNETFGGEVAVAGGSYGFHRVSADVNAPLNAAKTLAFRLNTAYNYEDSFQNQGYPGFTKNLSIAPSLQFRPNDRLTINLDAEVFRGSNVGKQLIFFYFPSAQLGATRADELPVDYRQSYTGDGLTQQSHSTNFFGQVHYRLSPSFTSSTNLSTSRSYSNGFGPYFYLVPDAVATGDAAAPAGAHYLARADQSTGNSTLQAYEVQQLFNGDFRVGSLRNRVVLGLDFLRLDSNISFFGGGFDVVKLGLPGDAYRTFTGAAVRAAYAKTPPGTYPITTKTNTYSAFASDVLNLTDRLSVLAALRLDRFDNQGGVLYVPVDAYQQTALSPKFGVVYQPVQDRVALFANYQNSFTNLNSFQDTEGNVVRAKPEHANQAEAGVKLDAAGGRLSATVSYYDIRVKDLLRSTPTLALNTAQTQNGTQRSRGVEVNVIANPVRGVNVVAGFAYNDSKFTNSSPDVDGLRPNTASSPYLANLWLSYRVATGRARGLGAGFGGNYASDNKIQNTTTNVFILPQYTVLNASLFYDQPKYRLGVKMDNLTDKHYWTGYTTMNAQKLRSVVGSVAYKF
ncbi:TonB-dependent receptor domain-containing protein [Hymenobacter caeli]|uniref:Iron complex outermembrane receptor protein n=1 Tax=Hymenobacter caeli TaxID=2735894 RepID=A0ABX2FWT6_9BACT|nr:TonB-dependent receptor [Hymenobacter caeli]NRT20764.1 iron complex outermembrane receptor protein [Hymenobacter caeli]